MLSSNRRRKILVHSTQMKFAVGLGLTLFAYSLLLFAIAFFIPYVYPELKILAASLPYIKPTWSQFWTITSIIWPVLMILILMTAFFSIYLTHKVAGPLYRLKECAKELAKGNLSIRVRLRKGDELQDLAETTDTAVTTINKAMYEIRQLNISTLQTLKTFIETNRIRPAADQATLQQLEEALTGADRIHTILENFQLSDRGQDQREEDPSTLNSGNRGGSAPTSIEPTMPSREYTASISSAGT